MQSTIAIVGRGRVGPALAAALSDQSLEGPIVCVVSGGNIALSKFAELVTN